MTARRGHTLLELLVVLAVLGVMGALVAPSWREAREASRLHESTRAFVALLGQARTAAEERGSVVTLILDPATGRVWYETAADEGTPRRAGDLPLAGSVVVENAAPRMRFTFVPGGLAFGAPVRLRDGPRVQVVSLDPWSGDVHVDGP